MPQKTHKVESYAAKLFYRSLDTLEYVKEMEPVYLVARAEGAQPRFSIQITIT